MRRPLAATFSAPVPSRRNREQIMSERTPAIPDHIPESLVYDFDFYHSPELTGGEPHKAVAERLFREAPLIFYTPRNGGHWVVTRAGVALEMLRQVDKFSSDPQYNWAQVRYPKTLPNQVDPPDHGEYRRLVNPYFSPAAMQKMEPQIRALARRIIDQHLPNGRCEFVRDIGERFPVEIFLGMAGAPLSDRDVLTEMSDRFTRSARREDKLQGLADLGEYLRGMMRERSAAPGDDLLSRVAMGTFRGRPLDEEEQLGFATLLFLGGLDTVKATSSFIMLHLARHPDQYARIVAEPALVEPAVEELMRVHGVANFERGCTRDLEFEGIQFRKGDRFVMLSQIWGLDDREMSCPFQVDLNREVSRHMIFGAGPHRCLGSNLARVEIRVLLEEWTKSVPTFAIAPGAGTPTTGGVVWSPLSLPLVWPR
jgi:cytochrome P450